MEVTADIIKHVLREGYRIDSTRCLEKARFTLVGLKGEHVLKLVIFLRSDMDFILSCLFGVFQGRHWFCGSDSG